MKKSIQSSDKPYILIVEDENLFYRDIANYLKDKGFEVAPYTKNYKDAKKNFHDRLPDAVLMDIDLNEDLNGFNVAQYIREYSDVPIIFLSNLPTFENIEESGKSKADDFLIKSALRNNEQIFATLQMMLNKRKKQYPKYGIRVFANYKYDSNIDFEDNNESFRDVSIDNKRKNITKTGEKSIILPFKDIAYITTFKDIQVIGETTSQKGKGYQAFHSVKGMMYYKNETLQTLKDDILPDYFFYCSQSTLVNAFAVKEIINAKKIRINEKTIDVSDRYREQFFKELRKFYAE